MSCELGNKIISPFCKGCPVLDDLHVLTKVGSINYSLTQQRSSEFDSDIRLSPIDHSIICASK